MCASLIFSESKLQVEECIHVDKFMNLGSELRKNFLFILYQLSVDETTFLHVSFGLIPEFIVSRYR